MVVWRAGEMVVTLVDQKVDEMVDQKVVLTEHRLAAQKVAWKADVKVGQKVAL